jgi:hypothetical protein
LSRWIGGLIIGGYGWSSTQNCVAKHRSVEGFLAAAVDKTNNHHQRKSMHLDYFHAAPNDTVTLAHRFLPFLASLLELSKFLFFNLPLQLGEKPFNI